MLMKMKGEAPVPDTRRQQLMEDLARTKSALDRAYSNFENVVDPDLVDSSIYRQLVVTISKRVGF